MQLPASIGKYELEEFLGGGMSQVFRARDTVIGRTVAVKILTEAGCQDPEVKARFLAEARMAGNIEHDNVISVYDFGEDEQHRPFMVMEFLRGEDLRGAIKNGHTGDLKSKLKIALQAARALEYVHTQKIIHRDIKPENLHINSAGVVKLMDFGIAKTEGLAMTQAGYVLGTPYYMAPEQVTGQGITDQVDVYSFGVLMFELMTGTKPIGGDSVERIFYSILHEPLNLEPLRQAGLPQSVCDLVAQCTMKNPAERPQGFAPVCASIEKLIAVLDAPPVVIPEPPVIPPPPPPAKMPVWLVPVVLLGVAVLGVGGYLAFRPKPPVGPTVPDLPKTLALPSGDMVLVPGGPFLFGDEKKKFDLPSFYIDKTEVTNAAYEAYCKDKGVSLPKEFPKDKPGYPVVYVSVADAQGFAKWAGKRLPTSREWEKAARGPNGLMFPWGNDPDPSRANMGHDPGSAQPAADFSNGAGPYGALNMVGNVWELVDETAVPTPNLVAAFNSMNYKIHPGEPWYRMRGGAFNIAWSDFKIWDPGLLPSGWTDATIGFRCVKDPP